MINYSLVLRLKSQYELRLLLKDGDKHERIAAFKGLSLALSLFTEDSMTVLLETIYGGHILM